MATLADVQAYSWILPVAAPISFILAWGMGANELSSKWLGQCVRLPRAQAVPDRAHRRGLRVHRRHRPGLRRRLHHPRLHPLDLELRQRPRGAHVRHALRAHHRLDLDLHRQHLRVPHLGLADHRAVPHWRRSRHQGLGRHSLGPGHGQHRHCLGRVPPGCGHHRLLPLLHLQVPHPQARRRRQAGQDVLPRLRVPHPRRQLLLLPLRDPAHRGQPPALDEGRNRHQRRPLLHPPRAVHLPALDLQEDRPGRGRDRPDQGRGGHRRRRRAGGRQQARDHRDRRQGGRRPRRRREGRRRRRREGAPRGQVPRRHPGGQGGRGRAQGHRLGHRRGRRHRDPQARRRREGPRQEPLHQVPGRRRLPRGAAQGPPPRRGPPRRGPLPRRRRAHVHPPAHHYGLLQVVRPRRQRRRQRRRAPLRHRQHPRGRPHRPQQHHSLLDHRHVRRRHVARHPHLRLQAPHHARRQAHQDLPRARRLHRPRRRGRHHRRDLPPHPHLDHAGHRLCHHGRRPGHGHPRKDPLGQLRHHRARLGHHPGVHGRGVVLPDVVRRAVALDRDAVRAGLDVRKRRAGRREGGIWEYSWLYWRARGRASSARRFLSWLC